MWSVWKELPIEIPTDVGISVRMSIQIPDNSTWRQFICQLINTIGNILTMGRRESWLLDRVWTRSFKGLLIHSSLKDMLLYGKIQHGASWWEFYGKCEQNCSSHPPGISHYQRRLVKI